MLASTALAVLFLGVGGYALVHHQPAPPPLPAQFDSYLWFDLAAAEAALRTRLAAEHPVGSNAALLLARLERGGFRCNGSLEVSGAYDCTYQRPTAFDGTIRLETRVLTDGTRLRALTPVLPGGPLRASHATFTVSRPNG